MKLWRKIAILTALCALLAATVLADVIVEPEDHFWRTHTRKCDYLYRVYTINGAEGCAPLWESPESQTQTEVLPNGTEVAGEWHYTDKQGTTWSAITGDWSDNGNVTVRGWLNTGDAVPVPDYISFREAHEDEFIPYDGSCDEEFAGASQVVLWKYPGSDVVIYTANNTWFQNSGPLEEQFETCWRDDAGRLWGFCGYCYGIRNVWICLSDPENEELEADPGVLPEQPALIPPADTVPAPQTAAGGAPWLAAGAVAVVMIVSAGLIVALFAKKRRQDAQ